MVKRLSCRARVWLAGLGWIPCPTCRLRGTEQMPRTLGPETPGTRRRLGQSRVTLTIFGGGGTRFADVVLYSLIKTLISQFDFALANTASRVQYYTTIYRCIADSCRSLLLPRMKCTCQRYIQSNPWLMLQYPPHLIIQSKYSSDAILIDIRGYTAVGTVCSPVSSRAITPIKSTKPMQINHGPQREPNQGW